MLILKERCAGFDGFTRPNLSFPVAESTAVFFLDVSLV